MILLFARASSLANVINIRHKQRMEEIPRFAIHTRTFRSNIVAVVRGYVS